MASTPLLLIIVMNTSAAGENVTVKDIADGAYTAPQAALGEREYQRNCSVCHMSDLTGSERVPSLAGESFLQRWQSPKPKRGELPQYCRFLIAGQWAAGWCDRIERQPQLSKEHPYVRDAVRRSDTIPVVRRVRRGNSSSNRRH
jgi:hypothetical protein